MNTRQFVSALAKTCRDSAVDGCIQRFSSPPGREPSPNLVALSAWFKSLRPADREMVVRAMRDAADSTLFGVLCVIDGARVVEDGSEKSVFRLTATNGNVTSVLSPGEELLHDIYRSEP